MISCKFCKIFKNTIFTEHFHVTTSDIRIQVFVIYNLIYLCNFPTINFTLFREFSRWSMLQCRLSFYIDLFFGWIIFRHDSKTASKEEIRIKHNIQKTQIHIFYNRLLGAVTKVLQLFLVFSDSIRIVLKPTLKCVRKLGLLEILVTK